MAYSSVDAAKVLFASGTITIAQLEEIVDDDRRMRIGHKPKPNVPWNVNRVSRRTNKQYHGTGLIHQVNSKER